MSAAATTAGATALVFGSGAFTSVEATRDYGLSIAPDDEAQLAIEPGDGATGPISDSDGVLRAEFDAINPQATTFFADAIRITNQQQSGESVFVYFPRTADVVNGTLEPTSDVGHESVEFLVDTTNSSVLSDQGDGSDLIDISLPPQYPDQTTAFDNGTGASGPKTANTGAVELEHGGSVQVDIRFLVSPGDESELTDRVARFSAQPAEPTAESAWSDIGALAGQSAGNVLDSRES